MPATPGSDRSPAGPIDELVERLLDGQRRALARALSRVENGTPDHLQALVRRLHPLGGRARILGVTGAPGVGKSTLTNALAAALRARDRRVGVLAVDPSSPFSGGALLGDRVRMQGHHADEGVFIRSMAARGHLGGLSFATPQAVVVLDAAGFDDVIVETVGVGQSEIEIAETADTTVVAMAPGFGDSIQAAKAGILEIADVFVVNKADQPGPGKLESELRGMLEMGHATGSVGMGEDAWWPPIVRTVAVRGEGIEDLVTSIDDHGAHLQESGQGARRRHHRAVQLVRELALARVRARFELGPGEGALDELGGQVAARELDPYTAADRLLAGLDGGRGERSVRSSDGGDGAADATSVAP